MENFHSKGQPGIPLFRESTPKSIKGSGLKWIPQLPDTEFTTNYRAAVHLDMRYFPISKNQTIMKRLLLFIAVILLTTSVSYTQGVLTVCDSGCAHATIQEAIDASMIGDTVKVLSGTYVEDVDATGNKITLTVGESPGCATIMGNLTLDSTVTYLVDIWGTTSCTEFDSTHVTDTLNLNMAALEIELNGFVPTAGDEFVIFTAGTLMGEFSQGDSITVNGTNFNINYSGNQVTLTTCDGFEAEVSGLDIVLSGCTVDLAAIPVNGTAPFSFEWEWGLNSSTDSIVSDEIFNGTTFNLTITDGNGCTATTSHTVETLGVVEIADVCVCTDGGDSTTFIVTFNNWPNCSGPFDIGINYPAISGSGNTTVAGIPLDSSTMTTVVFGPVGNAQSTGNVSINGVSDQSTGNSISINGDPVAYTAGSAVEITSCPDPMNVETEAGECFGLIPDLTGDSNLMWTGECGMTFTVEQSEPPMSMFGSSSGETLDLVITVTNDDCQGSDTCIVVLTLADNEDPELINPGTTCSSLDETDINSCLDDAEGFDGTTLETEVANLYEDNCGPVNVNLTTTNTISGSDDCGWTIEYTYTIDDGNGNEVNCMVVRSGGSQDAPIITLMGQDTVVICQGTSYSDAGATAEDACGNDITDDIVVSDPVDVNTPGTYTVTYNVMACLVDATEVTRTVIVHQEPEIGITVNNEEVGFGASFEFCYDDDIEVILEDVVSGTAPFELSWEVFVDGSMTADPTLSGDTSGVGVGFEFFTGILEAGEYEVSLTSLVDANGCEPSNIGVYTMTITVHEEPEIDIEVNGDPVGFGDSFEFCYDETVTVSFAGMTSGDEPVDIAWTVTPDPGGLSGSATGISSPETLFSDVVAAGSYTVELTSFEDANGCSPSDLSAYTMTITVYEEPEIGITVNDEEVGFGASFEFCYDENIDVVLEDVVSGTAPFELSWEVFVDGSMTADPSLSGDTSGVGVGFEFFTGILEAGEYEISLTSLVDANGCEPSDIGVYTMTITVYDESEIGIEVNDEEAGFGASFEFCYDENIDVILADVVSGTAPFELSWEVFVDGSMTADPTLSGDTSGVGVGFEFFSGILDVGEYEISLTSLVDANGCEPFDLSVYTMTIRVHPEPDVFFTLNGEDLEPFMVLEICCDEENIDVELVDEQGGEQAVGQEPFDMEFTIDGGTPIVLSGINFGHIEDMVIHLPMDSFGIVTGDYLVEVTSFTDANGCALSSGALAFYQFTISVNSDPVVLDCPSDTIVSSCQTQGEIEDLFSDWLAEFLFTGGCNATADFDGSPAAPDSCGGVTTVTYRVESDCEDDVTCTRTFTVEDAPEVDLICPDSPEIEAECQDQAAIDAAFSDWLSTASFTGGCNGSLSNDNTGAPDACGGNTTVTFTVESNCEEEVTCTATFTVEDAPMVVLDCPSDTVEGSCQTQAAIDAAFSDWLSTASFTGGCNASADFDGNPAAPDSCGGLTTVIYRVESDCEDDVICTRTFTVEDAPVVLLDCPSDAIVSSCLTQGEIENLFSDWLAEFSFSGGCNATADFDGSPAAPDSCGGLTTVTYRVESDCEDDVICTRTFTVEDDPIVLDCPLDTIVSSCQTQGEIDNLFSDWLSEFSFSGGCNTSGGFDVNPVAPDSCGGMTTLTYMVNSDCEDDVTCTRTFTVEDAPAVELTCPDSPEIVAECQDQTSIDAAFGDWLASASFTGGCNGILSNDNTGAPDACGGSATVMFTVESSCEQDVTCTATFTVEDASAVELTCPDSPEIEAECQDQASIDAAFVDWLATASFTGGCNGTLSNDHTGAPDACGGSTTVMFTVESSCEGDVTCTATFTVEDASAVDLTCPDDETMMECPVDQDAVDAAFQVWLDEFDHTGCATKEGFDDNPLTPDFCGGTTEVTYRVESDCEDDVTCTRTFTVENAEEVEIICPEDLEVSSCQSQSDVDSLFAAWMAEFEFSGGCNASEDFDRNLGAPDSCGGSIEVTYVVESSCEENAECTRTFTVEGAPEVVLDCPSNTIVDSCQSQAQVDSLFSEWMSEFSFEEGCNATADFDGNPAAPDSCGGLTTVIYRVESDCEDDVVCQRTFTVESAPVLEAICPESTMVDCPLPDNFDEVDSVFVDWINSFMSTGGCGTITETDLMSVYESPETCPAEVEVTYEVTDECGQSSTCTAVFIVKDTIPCHLICPDTIMVDPDPDLCGSIVEYEIEIGGYCPMNGSLEPEQTEGLASGDTFPIGITTNVWELYIAMKDTTVTCEFDVIVDLPVPVDSEIVCNSGVNVSVNDKCRAVVTPDEMLAGNIPCVNDFHEVDIEGRGTDTVDINDIGATLSVKVTRLDIYGEPTGNYCWGEIFVEDKIPPTIECVNDTISCLDDRDFILPTAMDNCGEVEKIRLLNEEFDTEYCDENYIRRIIRTYDAVDSSGNVSESCTQEIYIERVNFEEVVFPEDKTVENENPLLCDEDFELASNGNPSPSSTGWPRIGDVYIVDSINLYCGFSSTFSDVFLASTPCKTKIMRTWTIREWRCDTAQIVHTETQIIEIVDKKGPEMTCPQNMTVTTSAAHTCSANVYINRPMAIDSCNEIHSISLQYPGGFSEDWETGILNLPVGVNELNFTAYDICFNSSTCSTTITVVDQTPPVAICKESTVVALTVDGTARVNAGVFNNGSFDRCGSVSFQVKRMDMGCDGEVPEFGSYVDFFCCDLEENPIRIILQVTDEAGNTNECMVQVVVQDKLSSIINCPPNIIVSCEFDFDESDLTVFGSVVKLENLSDLQDPALDPRNPIIINDMGNPASQPQNFGLDGYAYNNCDVSITEQFESEYDECGRGEIRRTFYATGLDDNISSQCLQTIKIENMTPFDFEFISWPQDTMIENMCPGVDLDPQFLGTPDYEQGSCDKVHYTYTDQVFYTNNANDPVCFKVVRTWTVVDWCQFENGHYATASHQQAIKVINNVAPTITGNCEEITVSSFDTECEDGYVELIQSAEDDCTDEDQLVWRYDIDLHSNGIFDLSSNYNPRADVLNPTDASGTYPLGNHRIVWTVRDDCGNQTTCQQLFSVVNMTQPKAICKNGISVELMGMDTTGNGEFDTGVFELNASFLNVASYHTCGYGVSFAFSSDPDDHTRVFDCEDLGTHLIPLYVLAANQTQDVCIARVEIQDNMEACGSSGGTSGGGDEGIISGQIKMENGKTVQHVEVDLEGSIFDAVDTDEEGQFSFPAMSFGGSYEVVPEMDINPLDGVTTFDVALIQRHILGVQLFNSPYQWIAADIDKNGVVDVRDISQLRRLILGTYNHFPKNTSWRFVDADFVFSGFNPLDEQFNETYVIPDFNSNMPGIDFVGVKIGDINSSVNPSDLTSGSTERSSVNPLVFQIEDFNFSESEIVEIPVRALNFEDVDALQFTLLYDNKVLELMDVKGEAIAMDISNLGMHYLDEGMITFSWNDLLPTSVSDEEVLFTLVFEADQNGNLHGNMDIASGITEARAYVRGVAYDIQLNIENRRSEEGNYELFQNRPNPFSDQTLIGFKLPKDARATLTVFDVTGKVVHTITEDFSKGYNEVMLDNVSDWTNQVYYYRLDTEGFSASKKMIILR